MPDQWPVNDEHLSDNFRTDVDRRLRKVESFKQMVEARIVESDRISSEFGINQMKPSERKMLPTLLAAAALEVQATKKRISRLEYIVSLCAIGGLVEQIIIHLWPK